MKRLLICFLGAMLLVASLAIFVGAQVEDEIVAENPRSAWQIYAEEKLFPTIAGAGASIFGVYLMVLPVLSNMNKSSGTMGGAAKQFENALEELKKANESNKEKEERIAFLERSLEAHEKMMKESRKQFGELCRVFAIGWGSDEKMVKCGASREMMKVVEMYVGKEE